jgi:DNA polymerase-4
MRDAPLSLLSRALGSHAAGAQALARGEDEREVVPDREEKSISAEHTFEDDLTTLADARAWILRLAERVGERTRARQLRGRTITVKLRVPPFETMTRQASLVAPTSVTAEIAGAADRLLETWWRERRGARLRLLGVGLSGFGDDPAQVDLFAKPKVDRRDSLADEINRKFGRGAIRRARTLDADET